MNWQALGNHVSALGESPFWHPVEQRLYWVDILGMKILRCDGAGGAVQEWPMREPALEPGCIAPAAGGGLVLALRDGIYRARNWGGEMQLLMRFAHDPATTRFNDASVPFVPIHTGNAVPGHGVIPTLSMSWKSPWNVTSGSLHSFFITVICSASRRVRVTKSVPSAAYSTLFQPTPTDTCMRPPLSSWMVAICLAAAAVCRWGSTSTLVTNSSTLVAAARWLKSTRISWKVCSFVYGALGKLPTGDGNDDAGAPSMWS